MSEKISLKSSDFQLNISQSFSALRLDKELCDVTLLTEDQVEILAHKFVLSSSSSFFKSIVRRNSHSDLLIYLNEVSSTTLGLILDYVYLGQAEMSHGQLKTFLSVAEKLKIQNLTEIQEPHHDDNVGAPEEVYTEENDTETSVEVYGSGGGTQVEALKADGEEVPTMAPPTVDKRSSRQKIRDLFLAKDQDILQRKVKKKLLSMTKPLLARYLT